MSHSAELDGMSRDEKLKIGIEHHKVGEFDKAEQIYLQCFNQNPEDVEVLHLLGLLSTDLGIYHTAIRFFESALDKAPDFLVAEQQLAHALRLSGKYPSAIARYKGILAKIPEDVDALCDYAECLIEASDTSEAMAVLDRASSLDPIHLRVLKLEGWLALFRADNVLAENRFAQLLESKPDDVDALNWAGLSCLNQEKYPAAEQYLNFALQFSPDLVQARNNLGLALHSQGKLNDAVAQFNLALEFEPNHAASRMNLANTLRIQGKVDAAVEILEAVVEMQPDSAEALNNLATAYQDAAQPAKALECLETAARIWPDSQVIRWNLALNQLLLGDFKRGWANFESRWQGCRSLKGAYIKPIDKAWQGEPLRDKTLLLWAEQGFGDTLQFIRFAQTLAEQGVSVIAEVQPELVTLLSATPGLAAVVPQGATVAYDFHCPMMSLPYRLGIAESEYGVHVPYVLADSAKALRWKQLLEEVPGIKTGLVWAGSSRLHYTELAAIDARRSIPLEKFAPIVDVPGFAFFSLQKGGPSAELEGCGFSDKISDYSAEWLDFADTAAFIANLDMVVTVDTAVAHLAGAMGKPVWLLNRKDTCWRWLQGREDSTWYPGLRQFRQTQAYVWDDVIANMANAMQERT